MGVARVCHAMLVRDVSAVSEFAFNSPSTGCHLEGLGLYVCRPSRVCARVASVLWFWYIYIPILQMSKVVRYMCVERLCCVVFLCAFSRSPQSATLYTMAMY